MKRESTEAERKYRAGKVIREAALVAACGLLYLVWVSRTGIGFPCVFRLITGFKCPGCGITHAAIHLSQGRFAEAWADNQLVILLLPVLLPYLVWRTVRYVRTEEDSFSPPELVFLILMFAVTILFGVLRNTNINMLI